MVKYAKEAEVEGQFNRETAPAATSCLISGEIPPSLISCFRKSGYALDKILKYLSKFNTQLL